MAGHLKHVTSNPGFLSTLFPKIQRKQPSLLSRFLMVSAWILLLNFLFTNRQITIERNNNATFSAHFCIVPFASKESERAITFFFQIGSRNKRSSLLLLKIWKKASLQTVLRNYPFLLDRKMEDTTKQLVSEALELVLTDIFKAQS